METSFSITKGGVENMTSENHTESICESEKLSVGKTMESPEIKHSSQETSMSIVSSYSLDTEDVSDTLKQQNILKRDSLPCQLADGNEPTDIHELHQISESSSISSDLATESIYHAIIKQRNLLRNDFQPAKLPNKNELSNSQRPEHIGHQVKSVSSGDFSAECVYQDVKKQQNLLPRNIQQSKELNGDMNINLEKLGYSSNDSTIDKELGMEQQLVTIFKKSRQDEITHDCNNSHEEKAKRQSDEESKENSTSKIDRAYESIMSRYGGFKHFNPSQFTGNGMGKRDVSYAWNYKEDDTSTPLPKSDSIRNLLEAMHAMGVSLDIEDQPPAASANLNPTMPSQNEGFPKDISEANKNTEFRDQRSNIPNFECAQDDMMAAMRTINNSKENIKGVEMSGMMHQTIKKLLQHDLETTGCLNEESVKAVDTTVNEFSKWIDDLVSENEELKKLFGSKLQSTQGFESNRCLNDVITIRDTTRQEICEKLGNVLSSASKQELFNCEDSKCETIVVGHFVASSNLKTLIIRKKVDDTLFKYWLLEISPNVTIKTTLTTNESARNPLFTLHLKTSNYSFSLTL